MKSGPLRLVILGVCLTLSLKAQSLEIKRPVPVSGTPVLWNRTPRSINYQPLAKPQFADTSFYIRQDIFSENVTFIAVPFYLKYSDNQIAIYVEKSEYDAGRVTDNDVLLVKKHLLDQTPASSVNPNKGIYANELELFGSPPDKDHNGRLFVLLVDVRDGYVSGQSDTYVAGYFDPLDQMTHPDGKGNTAEIIYIDTNPACVSDLMTLSVVAHELQHLIHYNYDTDESVWLLEGLSELAPRILGLPTRSFGLFLTNTNRQLNDFDNSLEDYAKVGLWTYYIYQRFGKDILKPLVQCGLNSLASYEKVLRDAGNDLTKEQLLEDWFIANLVNDPSIAAGQYSYAGANIPSIYSNHFHSNFTEGTVSCSLKLAAAQYIQFFSGQQIHFNLQYPYTTNLKLAIVKHYSTPVVAVTNLTGSSIDIQDTDFGTAYTKITFIPFWTAITGQQQELSLQYFATGFGGYTEQELINDDGQTYFYINLQTWEAVEKFTNFKDSTLLMAVKIKMMESGPSTVRVYRQGNLTPLVTLNDLQPNEKTWTRVELPQPIVLQSSDAILISVSSSSENALGYSATETGLGRAFLKSGNQIYNLRDFYVEGTALTGDWQIRAVVQEKVTTPAQLVVTLDTLWFWHDEYTQTFLITNPGTEVLDWSAAFAGANPDFCEITPRKGLIVAGSQLVEVRIDRNLLKSGVYNLPLILNSNVGSDTVWITIKEPNQLQAQGALFPTRAVFDDHTSRLRLKFVNIGVGEATVAITSKTPELDFLPRLATIPAGDTLYVEAFLDRQIVQGQDLPFQYFDNVDTVSASLRYIGTLPQEQLSWLGAIYPNPFLVSKYYHLIIPVTLPDRRPFRITIHDLQGRQIFCHSIEAGRPGLNILRWDGKNRGGQRVASGIYLVRLSAGNRTERRKVVLLN
jgi:hypothetical protein